MTDKRNSGLDFIRFFAIILVLFAHTLRIVSQNPLIQFTVAFSAVWGVELFFVLSGFLIGSILIKTFNEFSVSYYTIKNFWIRRWFRTLPNYYLMVIVYLVYGFIASGSRPINGTETVKNLLFIQRLRPLPYHYSFFSASWNLCIEEWFYLLFPIMIFGYFFLTKNIKNSILFSVVSFIIFTLSIRLYGSLSSNWLWDEGYRKTLPLRIDGIAIGVLAAFINSYYKFIWNKKIILFVLGVVSQVVFVCIFKKQFLNNYDVITDTQTGKVGDFMQTYFFTLNSLSLICLLPLLSSIKITFKPIQTISLISYSIYVTHPLIIDINNAIGFQNKYVKFLSIWIEILLVAYIQYHFFEVKMTKLRDRFTNKNNSIIKGIA